jgi:hypothetical protein
LAYGGLCRLCHPPARVAPIKENTWNSPEEEDYEGRRREGTEADEEGKGNKDGSKASHSSSGTEVSMEGLDMVKEEVAQETT